MKKTNIILMLMFIVACAKMPATKTAEELKAPTGPPIQNPATMELKGEMGRMEISKICNQSVTRSYSKNNLLRERVEDLDFTVRSVIETVYEDGSFSQKMTTIEKNGPGSLHLYAFPELDEMIRFKFSKKAKVLDVEYVPRNSIFYMPPLPLPEKPVSPGDNWEFKHTWRTLGSDVPLTVSLSATYLNSKRCGNYYCMNIGIKGFVKPEIKYSQSRGAEFKHNINGRFLFEPTRGMVVWSEFETEELLHQKEARVAVKSLLRSSLLEPRGYYTANHEEPSCPF